MLAFGEVGVNTALFRHSGWQGTSDERNYSDIPSATYRELKPFASSDLVEEVQRVEIVLEGELLPVDRGDEVLRLDACSICGTARSDLPDEEPHDTRVLRAGDVACVPKPQPTLFRTQRGPARR